MLGPHATSLLVLISTFFLFGMTNTQTFQVITKGFWPFSFFQKNKMMIFLADNKVQELAAGDCLVKLEGESTNFNGKTSDAPSFDFNFLNKSNFQSCHEEKKKFSCDICLKKFPFKTSVDRHKITMHGNAEDKKFHCNSCGKSFNFKDRLNTHLQFVHSEVKLFACKFNCGTTFKHKNSKLKHEDEVVCSGAERKKHIKCILCEKMLSDISCLKRHMISVHCSDEEKEFSCRYCHKRFGFRSQLEEHYEVHGSEEDKKFQCNPCGKMFMSKGKLEQHSSVHSNLKSYACQYSCGIAFKANGHKKRHEFSCVLNLNRKFHICNTCKKEFTFKASLNKHSSTFHGCDEDKKFQCQLCGKRFSFKYRLKTHNLVHSNIISFSCKFGCGSSFKYNHNKKKHENKGCFR